MVDEVAVVLRVADEEVVVVNNVVDDDSEDVVLPLATPALTTNCPLKSFPAGCVPPFQSHTST